MEYEDIFSSETLEKLNKQSSENLKKMLGGRSLSQASLRSQELLNDIKEAESNYKDLLENLAIEIVKDIYPIVNQENIVIDAKISTESLSSTQSDEEQEEEVNLPQPPKVQKKRRRLINAITQGSAVRGAFAFYLFKENLDLIDDSLVEKYNEILKLSFGIYDDPNAIAMLLAMLAQSGEIKGGEVDVKVDRVDEDELITIRARAINFPMLVHEIVKGLYELISLYGFKSDEKTGKAVVRDVDKLEYEPEDLRYGKFIYDAIVDLYNKSNHKDTRVRDYFLSELYQLDDEEFFSFIENAINDKLSSSQKKWALTTMDDIADDLKADDIDSIDYDDDSDLVMEYSSKVIQQLHDKWSEESQYNRRVADILIKRFDQIKNGIVQKIDTLILPDRLKQGQKFKDITQYSFEELAKLVVSFGEKKDKIIKDGSKKFAQETGEPVQVFAPYLRRFLDNKNDLKNRVEQKDSQALSAVPDNLLPLGAYLDPRNYKWEDLERLLDFLYPADLDPGDEGENDASSTGDKKYDKNDIEIYLTDAKSKCVRYAPKKDNRPTVSWCILASMYGSYRYGNRGTLTFYFVFDRKRTDEKEGGSFIDPYHAMVFMVATDPEKAGFKYQITLADNRGDKKFDSWAEAMDYLPSDLADRLNSTKNIFEPVDLSKEDIVDKMTSGRNFTVTEFKELPIDLKKVYVEGRAIEDKIPEDIRAILKGIKVEDNGTVTNLANIAINNGQTFKYNEIKDSEPLKKRYAVVKYRHNLQNQEAPVPLPFVPYLDDKAKEDYYEKYARDYLTFEYVEKYFGEDLARRYARDAFKEFEYLPKEARKYLENDRQKAIFDSYHAVQGNWEYDEDTNVSEELLADRVGMPEQEIITSYMTANDWRDKISDTQRQLIIEMIKKYDGNIGYVDFLRSAPFILESGDDFFLFMPREISKDSDFLFQEWVTTDEDGNILDTYNHEDYFLEGTEGILGIGELEPAENRVFKETDLKKSS